MLMIYYADKHLYSKYMSNLIYMYSFHYLMYRANPFDNLHILMFYVSQRMTIIEK